MDGKQYKNISTVEQLGIEPGQTGTATIPKDQEDRMVARRAIEVVGGNTTSESAPEPVQPTPPGVPDPPELVAEEEKEREGEQSEQTPAPGKKGRS